MESRPAAAVGALLVALSPVPGCADEGGRPVATTLGDTVVVESRIPAHGQPARLVPVARYGALDDPGPATLVQVRSLAVGPDGALFVYDHDQGIKRFDREGVRVVARPGAGPGEVRYVPALATGPGGELAALDIGNRRLLVVAPDGSSRSFRLPDGATRYHEDAVHFGDDGSLWLGMHPPFTADHADPTPRLAYLRLSSDGVFADSIVVPDRVWQRCPVRSEPRYRVGFWEDRREPYVPKALWARSPDGTLGVGCPDRYELDLERPDGTVLRIRRAVFEPPGLDPAHRRFLDQWSPIPSAQLADRRPAYARIILPGDGRVWVWPTPPAIAVTPTPQVQAATGVTQSWALGYSGAFDVFGEDGAWLGEVLAPPEMGYSGYPTHPPVVIRGDTVWAVTHDELGVSYVTRYEVRWPRPPDSH